VTDLDTSTGRNLPSQMLMDEDFDLLPSPPQYLSVYLKNPKMKRIVEQVADDLDMFEERERNSTTAISEATALASG
jgi:hypothetical protein